MSSRLAKKTPAPKERDEGSLAIALKAVRSMDLCSLPLQGDSRPDAGSPPPDRTVFPWL